jgi:hypothetical protein
MSNSAVPIAEDSWLRQLQIGDEVYWQAPDDTVGKGPWKIKGFLGVEPAITSLDSLVLMDGAAGKIAAHARELCCAHPGDLFPEDDWMYEVANRDTRLGYAEWVIHRAEAEGVPLLRSS